MDSPIWLEPSAFVHAPPYLCLSSMTSGYSYSTILNFQYSTFSISPDFNMLQSTYLAPNIFLGQKVLSFVGEDYMNFFCSRSTDIRSQYLQKNEIDWIGFLQQFYTTYLALARLVCQPGTTVSLMLIFRVTYQT